MLWYQKGCQALGSDEQNGGVHHEGKDMTGLSKEDLVICFSCAKLEVMDSALRCQRHRPN